MRISVFGHGCVGKTSLIKRYLYDAFDELYKETIEDIFHKDVICNNQMCDLTILDAAGNYQFPAMRKLAIQQSDGFIIVYSIDNIASFTEAKRLREIIVETKNTTHVPLLLVGNKVDAGFRRITPIEVNELIKCWGQKVQHVETSAKNNLNVQLVFTSLIKMVDEFRNEILEVDSLRVMNPSPFSNMRKSLRQSTQSLMQTTRKLSISSKNRSVSLGSIPVHDLTVVLVADPYTEYTPKKPTFSIK